MYGWWYSVKQNFSFTSKEITQVFWTTLAFAFIVSFRKWGVGSKVDVGSGISNLILAFIFVGIAMVAHVSLQKIVAIKLGYKATYSYWINGLLLSVLLAFLTAGYSGYIGFILPGAVMIEHLPQLRLGKFRYGTNLKDIARVALAGSIAHIILVMIVGIFYFASGRSDVILSFIIVNLFLAIYTLLPIPKIDVPTKMDSGSDGLAMFFFSRTLYVLVLVTVLVFTALVFTSISVVGLGWLFAIAFIIGCIVAILYSISIEQKN